MKLIFRWVPVVMSVIMAISCVKEITDSEIRKVDLTFSAYAGNDTKTILAEGNEVHWLPGDEIAVSGSEEPFVASVTEASSFTEFIGSAYEMSSYYAVYPYSLFRSWTEYGAQVEIPDVQKAVNGSFADDLNLSVAKTGREEMSLRFKNVSGYVKFTLPDSYDHIVHSVTIKTNADEPLAGVMDVDFSDENPVLSPTDNGSSSVELASSTPFEAGTYYVSVIPGTYSDGLSICFKNVRNEEAVIYISGELTMNMGQIRNIGMISDLSFEKNEAASVPDNEIWYTSADGRIVAPYKKSYVETFGAGLLSNTYEDGKGILRFDGSVTKLGESAFYNKDNITSVLLPDSVTEIENQAFFSCNAITEVALPATLRKIGKEAFSYCGSMSEMYLPESITEIGTNAFFACTGTLFVDCNIGEYACNKSDFHEVHIGENVTSIGVSAFNGNSSLREIHIPDNVAFIEAYSFSRCTALEKVTIGKGIRLIAYYAFDGCSQLDEIIISSLMPPQANESFLGDIRSDKTIYVPGGLGASYSSMPFWRDYASMIVEDESLGTAEDNIYVSTDYSSDGKVFVLQQATIGNGIDVVIMGDGYSDRMIADGTYDRIIRQAYEAFFAVEPYTTYRDCFNVYAVRAVSRNELIGEGYDTALSTVLGEGTKIYGDNETIFSYALNAVDEDRMDETLIIVPVNCKSHSGACFMFHPDGIDDDYCSGSAIAFSATGRDDVEFETTVHHECGHGFAKLADEYFYEYKGAITEDEIAKRTYGSSHFGWWKNADFTNDPDKVKWAHFLNDERYAYEGLGVFEGAFTYPLGAWRSTESSIMSDNVGGFNAPSREAIWYRIHKLAYGKDWVYDYEDFVEYDVINRNSSAAVPMSVNKLHYSERVLEPTAPPVIIEESWSHYVRRLKHGL